MDGKMEILGVLTSGFVFGVMIGALAKALYNVLSHGGHK
jgi:hypothetical protein